MKSLLVKLQNSWLLLLCRLHPYHVLPAIFWACLVYIGHHALPIVFDAPDQIAYSLIQNVLAGKAQNSTEKKGLVALVSDQTFYGAPYYGEEPTQRCAVLESLQKIVIHNPKALVVDINLSPTYRDLLAPSNGINLNNCQNHLEQFLIQTSTQFPVLLIDPMQFPVDSDTTLDHRIAWRKSMEKKGLHFGHADIQHSMLSALTHYTLTPAKLEGGKRSENKTEQGMNYRLCQLLECNKELAKELPLKEGVHLINYTAFAKFFDTKFTEHIEFTDIKNKIVYFGFGVQGQDQRTTPIGEAYGVQVHAAYYASMVEPIKIYGWLDIIGDVLIGILISSFGNKLIERFLARKKEEINTAEHLHPFNLNVRYAYLNVIYLVAFAFIAALAVMTISYLFLASSFRVWSSPLVMIFAMYLDLFCRAPFAHLLPHFSPCVQTTDSKLSASPPVNSGKRISTLLWLCVAWGVPLYCFWQLLNSHH